MKASVHDRTRHLIGKIRIYLDGVDVTRRCIAFDTEEGWAELYIHDLTGEIIVVDDHPQTQVFWGTVIVDPLSSATREVEPVMEVEPTRLKSLGSALFSPTL